MSIVDGPAQIDWRYSRNLPGDALRFQTTCRRVARPRMDQGDPRLLKGGIGRSIVHPWQQYAGYAGLD